MHNHTAVIITTINKVSHNLLNISKNCKQNKWLFVLIGDKKSPKNFKIPYGKYFDISAQKKTNLSLANNLPLNSYSRKNIGYLVAIMNGAKNIIETDDDNFPYKSFFKQRQEIHYAKIPKCKGFFNLYKYCHDKNYNSSIWQRGLPFDEIENKNKIKFYKKKIKPLVLQGLCDGDPDVDAIYRILNKKISHKFKKNVNFGITNKIFSPTNSQNTTWFYKSFPLMYLPTYCSMRATDIWRGYISQVILNNNNNYTLFHGPNIKQIRNHHDLIKDLKDEFEVYKNSKNIVETLLDLDLKKGEKNFVDNLNKCYMQLCKRGFFHKRELKLLKFWINDLNFIFKAA